jgi:adenylate kinase
MLNIILFGPPGSGKGTQSLNIINRYNLVHLSTGDIMREEMSRNSPLGQTFKKYIDKGRLVPDKIVMDMLYDRGASTIGTDGMIFDGFPRTIVQAKKLDILLAKNDNAVDFVISIEVTEDEILKRLLGRGQDSGRTDDKHEIIKQRIEVYKDQTFPLIDYYRKQGKFVSISGMFPVAEVFKAICEKIDKYLETGKIE